MTQYILSLDQGTTSSRAIVFGHDGRVVSESQQEFNQILPQAGHVEHDAEEIWDSQLSVARQALAKAGLTARDIAALGIANQRETTVLWDRVTGRPVDHAVVWQSRVSSGICTRLQSDGLTELFSEKTGLLLDPYFSGTKIKYLLEKHPGLHARAERGEVLFGTVDSYLIWKLTGGKVHATDYSNASRTLIYNIHTLEWDEELLEILGIPRAMLPRVLPSSTTAFGESEPGFFDAPIPIAGVAGDQQAATFGQACFEPGSAKSTYGTGAFLLMNTGQRPMRSENRLLTTIGWGIGDQITYCLEGSVFVAGAVVQWLRDGLGLIQTSSEVEELAASVPDAGGVYLVPAFVGLGAPHWDPHARGMMVGLTRGTQAGHLARAAVESMAFQTRDLIEAMQKDARTELSNLKVDGGACVNDDLMQFQADLLGSTISRPTVAETTALGAAYLAGLAVGYWEDLQDVTANWVLDKTFQPTDRADCEQRYAMWQRAVERSLAWDISSGN